MTTRPRYRSSPPPPLYSGLPAWALSGLSALPSFEPQFFIADVPPFPLVSRSARWACAVRDVAKDIQQVGLRIRRSAHVAGAIAETRTRVAAVRARAGRSAAAARSPALAAAYRVGLLGRGVEADTRQHHGETKRAQTLERSAARNLSHRDLGDGG